MPINLLKEKILEVWNRNKASTINNKNKPRAVLAESFNELPRRIKKLLPFTQVINTIYLFIILFSIYF